MLKWKPLRESWQSAMEMDHWALSKIEDDIIFEEKIINKWRQTIDNSFIRL